jgi:hypothetical protein
MRALVLVLAAIFALGTVSTAVWAAPPTSKNFSAHLSGDEEVPVRETKAQGQVKFKVNGNGTEISYKLIVANIENVVAGHIHCAASGANGPVGVTIFGPQAPGGGGLQGVIARGTIAAPDAGNSCGWMTVEDVVAAMLTGNTYVNVHTNDGVAPTNTGPGDFPGGEIRGQLGENGPS